jgi:hypothetical protein
MFQHDGDRQVPPVLADVEVHDPFLHGALVVPGRQDPHAARGMLIQPGGRFGHEAQHSVAPLDSAAPRVVDDRRTAKRLEDRLCFTLFEQRQVVEVLRQCATRRALLTTQRRRPHWPRS